MPLIKTIKTARSAITKHFKPLYVGDTPHMDAEEIDLLRDLLSKTDTYMEYGCGGSTKMAISQVKHLISVENDVLFSKALRENLANEKQANSANISFSHQTLGPSGKWGHPVYTFNTPAFRKRRDDYVSKPWDELRRMVGENVEPDLILIDGRFRMASALYSLIQLDPGSDTLLFFHDYNTRPIYHEMEPFMDVQQRVASTVLFKRKNDLTTADYENAFKKYANIWQ